jgi:hypothetical protein
MSHEHFADRLTADRYADDEPVGIFETDPSEPNALWISDRLFGRLVLVARAYELHVLPMLGGTERITLGREQCESFLDELEFVAERLHDELAVTTAQSIADYLTGRIRSSHGDVRVSVEGS